MTMARSRLVDPSVTRWYHWMTRWLRGADLLAKVPEDRQAWIEQRLQEFAQTFAVGVGGFSVILEESLWLCPIEDRRKLDSSREGC